MYLICTYLVEWKKKKISRSKDIYFYRPEASHFTGNEDIIIK